MTQPRHLADLDVVSEIVFGECGGIRRGGLAGGQGLTLVHISAQPEPFLIQKFTLHTPEYRLTSPTQPLNTP